MVLGGVHGDVPRPRGARLRAGVRDERLVAVHPRVRPAARPRHQRPRVPRGRDRPHRPRPLDRVPAHDLLARSPAARCWSRSSRCAPATRRRACTCWCSRSAWSASTCSTTSGSRGSSGSPSWRRPTRRSGCSASSAHRSGHRSWVTASGAVLDGASLRLAAVDLPFDPEAGHLRAGRVLRAARDRRLLRHPVRPRPAARRSDQHHQGRVPRRRATSWWRPGSRCATTATPRGSTSPAGA